MNQLSKTALLALNAYGGIDLWQNHRVIEALVNVKGLAFTLKRRPFFSNVNIALEIHKPYSKISPIGKDKQIVGVLENRNVRLEDLRGNIINERKDARSFFSLGRRLFYWDDMDMAYFANYAFWNYFTLPNLLLNESITWIEIEYGKLKAVFPNHIPTHSKFQEFYFDIHTGLLQQHNYTVDIISNYAKVANVVLSHDFSNIYPFPSKRIVTPVLSKGKVLQGPVMIDMEIKKFKII